MLTKVEIRYKEFLLTPYHFSLRKDERPWCSTDEIFVGNFIFCPESEEELSHRLSRVKGKQLFTEAMAVLNANSRPEKYIVGLELLENSVDLGCEEAIIQTALFQVFGLHYEQVYILTYI